MERKLVCYRHKLNIVSLLRVDFNQRKIHTIFSDFHISAQYALRNMYTCAPSFTVKAVASEHSWEKWSENYAELWWPFHYNGSGHIHVKHTVLKTKVAWCLGIIAMFHQRWKNPAVLAHFWCYALFKRGFWKHEARAWGLYVKTKYR